MGCHSYGKDITLYKGYKIIMYNNKNYEVYNSTGFLCKKGSVFHRKAAMADIKYYIDNNIKKYG